MTYTISITIDSAGLSTINAAGQSVALISNIIAQAALIRGTTLPITWLVFKPLSKNVVTWNGDCLLYATATPLQFGATIQISGQTNNPIQLGWLYTFAQGQFTGASGLGDTYNLDNQMPTPPFSFGLAQQATVNSVQAFAPLNALPVLNNETANFLPTGEIWLFLTSIEECGTVMEAVPDNALSISLTRQQPAVNVGFNDSTNTFYLNS
ncbi:hypothetical protein Sinac_2949 [Singulisphaera acidiphila DSM 18658]|uniref:Uncharacterized protein n=2 Tax=Singulisphaera acidiphila TaxID=466153 RepID=L0DEI2_SINAD|nr:hypothetical protein Sinac_2949 [Singulisphaera acidiphila DSM 18658]